MQYIIESALKFQITVTQTSHLWWKTCTICRFFCLRSIDIITRRQNLICKSHTANETKRNICVFFSSVYFKTARITKLRAQQKKNTSICDCVKLVLLTEQVSTSNWKQKLLNAACIESLDWSNGFGFVTAKEENNSSSDSHWN